MKKKKYMGVLIALFLIFLLYPVLVFGDIVLHDYDEWDKAFEVVCPTITIYEDISRINDLWNLDKMALTAIRVTDGRATIRANKFWTVSPLKYLMKLKSARRIIKNFFIDALVPNCLIGRNIVAYFQYPIAYVTCTVVDGEWDYKYDSYNDSILFGNYEVKGTVLKMICVIKTEGGEEKKVIIESKAPLCEYDKSDDDPMNFFQLSAFCKDKGFEFGSCDDTQSGSNYCPNGKLIDITSFGIGNVGNVFCYNCAINQINGCLFNGKEYTSGSCHPTLPKLKCNPIFYSWVSSEGDGICNCGEDISSTPDCQTVPTCDDGIQNQNEIGVDCGGSCPSCSESEQCKNKRKDENEGGIDCGGPCSPCEINPYLCPERMCIKGIGSPIPSSCRKCDESKIGSQPCVEIKVEGGSCYYGDPDDLNGGLCETCPVSCSRNEGVCTDCPYDCSKDGNCIKTCGKDDCPFDPDCGSYCGNSVKDPGEECDGDNSHCYNFESCDMKTCECRKTECDFFDPLMCGPDETVDKDPETNCKECKASTPEKGNTCPAFRFGGRTYSKKNGVCSNSYNGEEYDPTKVSLCEFETYIEYQCQGCKTGNTIYQKFNSICGNNCYNSEESQCCASDELCDLSRNEMCCQTGSIDDYSSPILTYNCVNLDTDEENCGLCRNKCWSGSQCCNGVCGEAKPDYEVFMVSITPEVIIESTHLHITAVIHRFDEVTLSDDSPEEVIVKFFLNEEIINSTKMGLAPDSSELISIKLNVQKQPGEYELKIVIDPDNEITNECDKTNNEFAQKITVHPKPDLKFISNITIGCYTDEQCDDFNPCTEDKCENNTCKQLYNTIAGNDEKGNYIYCAGEKQYGTGKCCHDEWFENAECCSHSECACEKTCVNHTCRDDCPSFVCWSSTNSVLQKCSDYEGGHLPEDKHSHPVNCRGCACYYSFGTSNDPPFNVIHCGDKVCDDVDRCVKQKEWIITEPQNVQPGDILPVNALMYNTGPTNASNFITSFYVNGMQKDLQVNSITGGETKEIRFNWTMNSSKYNISIEADSIPSPDGLIPEISEDNNMVEKCAHCPLTQELCESVRGTWDECGSACFGQPAGTKCILECIQYCYCGPFNDNQCPDGYYCWLPYGPLGDGICKIEEHPADKVCQGSQPPQFGDWILNEDTYCNIKDINLDGVLNIGGKILTLENVYLNFNSALFLDGVLTLINSTILS